MIINGKAAAEALRQKIKNKIAERGIMPGLAAILVGDDPASHIYISLKEQACAEVGIHFEKYVFTAEESQSEIIKTIRILNSRPEIHAILTQMPLPNGFDEDKIVAEIDPMKDVDGFHPANLSRLINGTPFIVPGVALGIFELIKLSGCRIRGARAVLLANSPIFAAPIEYLLEKAGALVHIILTPPDLNSVRERIKQADILVTAIGRPETITGDLIKEGSVVIDVGTSRFENKKITGDVHFESASKLASALTPVPGGVGPMTVAMLIQNTLNLALRDSFRSIAGSAANPRARGGAQRKHDNQGNQVVKF